MSIQAIIGLIVAAILALTTTAAGCEHKRADNLQAQVTAGQDCAQDITRGVTGLLSAATDCAAPIAAAATAAASAQACDQALTTANTFGVQSSCSAPVKQTVAQRDAAAANGLDLQTQLKTARDGSAAAIARAQARGQTLGERKANADAALAAAPRDAAGDIVCDAGCLRARFAAPAAAAGP